jgi:tetratricopeptide (TPR) repeat protein
MRRRDIYTVAIGLAFVAVVAIMGAAAAVKPRSVLILPFGASGLEREEQWIGEGVAQSLMLGLAHTPALLQTDRARLQGLPQPDVWDEAAAQQAGKALRADLVVFGEVRRAGDELSIQPRYLELRGDRVERGALEPLAVPAGALMERLRLLPSAYCRAFKIALTDAEVARMQKSANATPSARAFESYVRGRLASNRGTQEGYEAAVDLLARAIEADAQFVAAQFALGSVHQALGNRWKAAAQYRAATQLDSQFPESYKALGDLFMTAPRRLFDQAVEAYTKALEVRPFYAEAFVGLGDAKAAKGDVDGAVQAYQKALLHNPMNPKVHVSLGKIYYSEKNLYFESVNAYKKGIDLDPTYLEARMGLAEVYEDKGLYPEAITEYRKVVEQDPKNTGALYSLALVYEKVDPKESMELWERYIQLASPIPSEKDWVDVARLHLRKLKSQMGKDKGN